MQPSTTGPPPYLRRELEARRDLEGTRVASWLAALALGAFLGLLVGVPVLDCLPGGDTGEAAAGQGPFSSLGRAVAAAPAAGSPLAANRALLAAMHRFEARLEDESWLVADLLPPVQLLSTAALGAGNEQVYAGRDGWLFYRPGVDALIGPPFLSPGVLRSRRRGGESWEEPVEPDPRPALRELHDQLARRGIRLLVLPVPGKAGVHPERLTPRRAIAPVENPSSPALAAELAREGIGWLDPAPLLVAAAAAGEPQFLRTDSHWTPAAMDRVAQAVARHIEREVAFHSPRSAYRRDRAEVEGIGDLTRMLKLPPGTSLFPPQRVTSRPVSGPDGAPWRPGPEAEVLLLGDSFTNVFSRADLGWGTGAGFAEQLSFHLQRPVDRIAVNAGGAHASRQALARELAAGRDRLAGKRIVVYQLAARELAMGDWRPLSRGAR
jgi:alginate O-acetyltransferase complex protein AlgJ